MTRLIHTAASHTVASLLRSIASSPASYVAVALSLLLSIEASSVLSMSKRNRSKPHTQFPPSTCATNSLKCAYEVPHTSLRHVKGRRNPWSIQFVVSWRSTSFRRICACRSRSIKSGEYHHLPRQSVRSAGSGIELQSPLSRWSIRAVLEGIGAAQAKHISGEATVV
jgi:hypothetical protein